MDQDRLAVTRHGCSCLNSGFVSIVTHFQCPLFLQASTGQALRGYNSGTGQGSRDRPECEYLPLSRPGLHSNVFDAALRTFLVHLSVRLHDQQQVLPCVVRSRLSASTLAGCML